MVIGNALNQETVMADYQKGSWPGIQQVFQDSKHVRIQVVAWLVQHQYVRLFQKDAQKCQTPTLATGEVLQAISELSAIKTQTFKQLRRALHFAVYQVTCLVLAKQFKNSPRLFCSKGINLLRKPAKFDGLAHLYQTRCRLQLLCHQLKKRRLTSAILAQNAIAVARANEPLDVLDDLCLRAWICVRRRRGSLVSKRDVMHLNDLLA